MPPEPFFGAAGFDRADALRGDPARLAELASSQTALQLLWDGAAPELDEAGRLRWGPVSDPALFLGFCDGRPRFSPIPPVGSLDFRARASLLGLLDPADAPAFAAALSLAGWHARHGYCATCGSPSAPVRGGWSRSCGVCGAEHYPRVDPVVIMLVEHDGRALLGRQPGFPPGFYSALAGFVEVGESIEQAVIREVKEEAGVEAWDIRYVASQPWPFPNALMIGCTAYALDDRLTIDRAELEDARWFSQAEVEAAMAGDPAAPLLAPPPFAIAHSLMRHWLDRLK